MFNIFLLRLTTKWNCWWGWKNSYWLNFSWNTIINLLQRRIFHWLITFSKNFKHKSFDEKTFFFRKMNLRSICVVWILMNIMMLGCIHYQKYKPKYCYRIYWLVIRLKSEIKIEIHIQSTIIDEIYWRSGNITFQKTNYYLHWV